MDQSELIELDGIVQEIKFTNEENGYTVCVVDVEDEKVIFVGTMPFLAPGEQLSATGSFVTHKNYGEQFKVEYYEKTLPQTRGAIMKFLSGGAIRGIGQRIAAKIVSHFGEETLDIIEYDWKKLSSISGITQQKAEAIHNAFMEQYAVGSIVEFLMQYNITPVEAMRIYNEYGGETLTLLHKNPYILCGEPIGINFERADAMARDLVTENLKRFRAQAGIAHIIRHNYGNGHTFIPREKLCEVSMRLLGESSEYLDGLMDQLLEDGELICYEGDGQEAIYLPPMFLSELSIAEKLQVLDQFGCAIPHTEADIDTVEQEFGIQYEHEQRRAIDTSMERGVFVLTGGPGTGKTTVIRAIIRLLQQNHKKVLLAAPTGRAAKRMSEVTGQDAKTVHRLLQVDYSSHQQRFIKNEKNPIKADCIIVDECSMIDVPLMDALLRATRVGCKLVLVGDSDQLPSIGPGNVLKDIIDSDCVNTIELTEIFRQARESLIVVNAHTINAGEMPELRVRNNDFFFLSCPEMEQIAPLLISLCRDRLPRAYGIDGVRDIQVISPTRKKEWGTVYLNKMLQDTLNPPASNKKEMPFRDGLFRMGDKVMQMKNNYNLEWKDKEGTQGTGIFNGDIGEIIDIEPMGRLVTVRFDDKEACYPYELLAELELAYVMTVHKSQGSEFPIVIFVAADGGPRLCTRNLLYTAVTRAKSMCILVGKELSISRMVQNDRQAGRYSSLRSMLETTILQEESS